MLKKILFGGENGLSTPANLALTILRVFAGFSIMMAHGLAKLPPSAQFVQGAAGIGFPLPGAFAWAASLSEFLGGAFLAIGLFTRVSAFFVCCTMVTALTGVHYNDPYAKKELASLYLAIAGAFLIMGANDWSIDRVLRK
jgi:putative oxidoreductase